MDTRRGGKGVSIGHMDEMIERNKKEVDKVMKAVKKVRTKENKIDKIIYDRITNQHAVDGFTPQGQIDRKFTAVNMNEFIGSEIFNKYRKSPKLFSGDLDKIDETARDDETEKSESKRDPRLIGNQQILQNNLRDLSKLNRQ